MCRSARPGSCREGAGEGRRYIKRSHYQARSVVDRILGGVPECEFLRRDAKASP